jgi:c-di-GMP-binding flagellar brake protein YcgR
MPEGDIYMERRKHKRAFTKMHVKYKVMAGDEFETVSADHEKKRLVTSEDISISGIQLICDEELKIDKVVRLDVSVDDGGQTLATFAEVRWVRRDEQLKKFRVGMEFLVIKEDHIAAIRKITGE